MEREGDASLYDTIIIGGGPAGFTAGLYAARANLRVLLIEGASTVSQITVTDVVENYPGFPEGINGFDLMQLFRKQAEVFGLDAVQEDVTALAALSHQGKDIWQVVGKNRYGALSVIIATGSTWRKVGVPGEESLTGKGVSYCATCDGPFYRDKKIFIIGGGDTAIQEALFLTNFAKEVTVVHRRNRLRATKILQDRAFANNKIRFIWESVVESIEGGDAVEGLKIKNLSTGAVEDHAAEGVFVFIGVIPNTDFVRSAVDCDPQGFITVDDRMQTSARGIFACGDCVSKLLRQVITACGDGATAAFSAQLYVEDLKGEAY